MKPLTAHIKKLDKAFFEHLGSFYTEYYFFPSNYEQEKEKFFTLISQRQKYNPVFTYPALEAKHENMAEFLQNVKIPDDPFGKLYGQVKQRFELTLEMIQNRSSENFTALSQKKYGIPSAELINEAQAILKKYRNHPIQDAYFGIDVVIEKLNEKLSELQIKDWVVTKGPSFIWMIQAMSSIGKILLPAGLLVNQRWIDKMIQQAIEVTIYQNQNAKMQPLHIFTIGLDRFEETQRGLMIELSSRSGLIESQSLRRHAGGVLASYLGCQFSFAQTYDRLSNIFSPNQAFELTAIAKMGLCETAEPGGLLNSHLALQGWKKVQNLTTQQLKHLFVGHVGIDQLESIETWVQEKIIHPPTWLPLILKRS